MIALFCATFVSAEQLDVSVKAAPPFVIASEGQLSGFSVDLIEMIAEDLGMEIAYRADPDLQSHLRSVREGDADLGIAATTITAEREGSLDFSHPFFESSQGALVKKDRGSLFLALREAGFFTILLLILAYILVCAHIIWFIERGKDNFSNGYGQGIWDGIWWTVVTMSTVGYGDIYPKRPGGRAFGILVIISGIAIFGTIVAGLTSIYTVLQLQTSIEGVSDLSGEKVAVIEGTQSVDLARAHGMVPLAVQDADEAIRKVLDEDAAALVYDRPLLQYRLKEHPDERIILLGETFEPAPYGIAFPEGSDLVEPVNRALLRIREDGRYARLQGKWFGNS